MSSEREAAVEAVSGLLARQDGEIDWELTCKRSVGVSLARRRDEASMSETWTEEALAVRVSLPDGRSALASAAGWGEAEAVGAAEAALADAGRQRLPCEPAAAFAASWSDEPSRETEEIALPDPAELGRWLDLVLEAAESADSREGRLELGRARAARVTSHLVNSRGLDLLVAQDLALLEAELGGRELAKHAGCSDAVAGSRFREDTARALGDKLGRGLRRQLDGVPLAPKEGRVLFTPEVVGEISFRLAPALLGLEGSRAGEEAPAVGAGLQLSEDSCADEAARSRPADGVGRPLERLDLVVEGRLELPESGRLPLVRPGIADPPRPGWLRLSWSAEQGRSDEELVAELGAGFLVERAVTRSFDAASLSWSGQVEGWWVEDGEGKRAVARLPLTLDLPSLLPMVVSAGAEPEPAHASGTIRAVPWLLDRLPEDRPGAR